MFQLGSIYNAVLGGLVGFTGGCDVFPAQYAPVVGLMLFLKIDDPADAVAVHGCGCFVGIICVGLFHKDLGLVTSGQPQLPVS